jgi:hypothetical protein
MQRLQNKALRTIVNIIPLCTPVCDFHTAFNLPYVYDCIKKLCRQQAEIIQNHENEHRKYKRLKLGGGQAYDRQSD